MKAIVRTLARTQSRGIAVLLVFALAAIALAVVFAHEVNRSFETSIDSSRRWMARLEKSEKPGNSASEIEELRRDSVMAARSARRAAVAGFAIPGFVLAFGLFYLRRANQKGLIAARSHSAALQKREEQLRKAIEERDARQRELDEQRNLLLTAARLAQLGVWTWDVATGRVTWSDELYRTFGVERETFVSTYEGYLALVHPDDLETVERTVGAAVANQQPYAFKHRVVRPDGTVRIIYAEGETETGPGGEVTRVTGIVQDMTKAEEASTAVGLSEERFRLAMLATNDTIWDLNLATYEIWLSERFKTEFGYPDEGGTSFENWLRTAHPEDIDRIQSTLSAAVKGTASYWSGEFRFQGFDGSWHEVFNRGLIVRDETGRAVRMVGAMADVTERNGAARSIAALSRQQELILKSAAEGIFGIDLEGHTRFINEAGARTLGWTVDELLGTNMHRMVHASRESGEPYPWEECPDHGTVVEGVVHSQDADTFWKRDGSPLPVSCTSNPMVDENGRVVGAVVTFRDITSRLAVDRMKDEFISTVSHELRTPLTSIRGAIGLLASGRVGALSEKGQRLADLASTNTDRLVRLINDILDIERMESGKVPIVTRPCVATDLIRQAVDVVRSLADREQITIETENQPFTVLADPDRIVQTLTNLIGNAVKFSPAGSTIRVAAEEDRESVVFTVADEGRGIPADKLRSIFGRFQQVDASDSREKGGSGLGLAISSSIVRQHGGEIWVESEPGAGSVFSFTIPRVREEMPPACIARLKRVLLCDDDEDARRLIATILTGNGYSVREAPSGHDLLALAAEEKPDLILLDLFMPDLNGWEALARLRSDPATKDIPVVIVSVLSADEIGLPFTSLSGWVQKPLDPESLLNAITNAFSSCARRPQIVLIEDDFDLARVIASSFERYGIEMFHASSGAEAIELATRVDPDLVVLDLVLPDIDGFQVVDWLKGHDRWRSVPLVVYSALEPTAAEKDRLILGRTEFFVKSRISPEAFEGKIVQLLDKIIESSNGAIVHAP